MVPIDWTAIIFGLGVLILGTIIITVVIWQVFATARAKMSVAREEAYQKLAEQSEETQRRTADYLEKAETELAALRQRVGELERILREVE